VAKLSISSAWDETRAVLRADGKLLTIVALALLVLPGTVSELVTPPVPQGQLPEPGPWLAVFIVAVLVAIVGQLAIVTLALGDRLSVGQAIGHGARRMPIYFVAQLIWALPFAAVLIMLLPHIAPPNPRPAAALLFILCFFVFLFIAVRMLLLAPISSADRIGPIAMIGRSWQLTSGSWWRLFGFLLLFLIAAGILILATAAIFGLVAQALPGKMEPFTIGALLVALATQIVQAGIYVVLMVMLARMYLQAGSPRAEPSVPSSGT
jgi:hypothetical protein